MIYLNVSCHILKTKIELWIMESHLDFIIKSFSLNNKYYKTISEIESWKLCTQFDS